MLQYPTDVMQPHFTEPCITVSSKEWFPALPDALVNMHSGSVVTKQWLRHKCRGFTVTLGHIFNNIFVPHQIVCTFYQRRKTHIDFTLPAGGHFMVVTFHFNANSFHSQQHLTSNVLQAVGRRHWKISFLVTRFVTQVRFFITPRVPGSLFRVHSIETLVGIILISHIIKDEKLRFRSKICRVTNSGRLEVGFRLLSNITRIL